MILDTRCSICQKTSAGVEVLAPGELPAEYATWSAAERSSYDHYQDLSSWRLRYKGLEGGNGQGQPIGESRARGMIDVLTEPITVARLDDLVLFDDAGVCRPCGVAYCNIHWRASVSGFGTCPAGHGKSLDAHSSPDDWDT